MEGLGKFVCIAAADGKLYAPPCNARQALEIDPKAGTVTKIGHAIEGDEKYECIVAGSNGKLYAAPYNALTALEIDPATGSVRSIGGKLEGSAKYECAIA